MRTWPNMPPLVQGLLAREGTGISWTDLTFNAWLGCTKVGPACEHCYAEDLMGTEGSRFKRVGWGAGEDRIRTSPATWAKPLQWQRIALAAGVTLDVFCLSLGDWADNEVPDEWRADLAGIIRETPNLRWLLLTKWIPKAERTLRSMFPGGVPANVCLGITVVTQAEIDRDLLRAVAVKRALRIRRLFLSLEPLLESVELPPELTPDIDLVIVGGESGKNARPMHPDWPLALGDQCVAHRVAFHFKQWGEFRPYEPRFGAGAVDVVRVRFKRFERGFADMERVGAKRAGRTINDGEWLERIPA